MQELEAAAQDHAVRMKGLADERRRQARMWKLYRGVLGGEHALNYLHEGIGPHRSGLSSGAGLTPATSPSNDRSHVAQLGLQASRKSDPAPKS